MKYLNESIKETLINYFVKEKHNSKIEYMKLVHENNEFNYMTDFFNDEFKDNVITFIFRQKNCRISSSALSKLSQLNPNWNHQDINGETFLFNFLRHKESLIYYDIINDKIKKGFNIDVDILNNKGENAVHLLINKDYWITQLLGIEKKQTTTAGLLNEINFISVMDGSREDIRKLICLGNANKMLDDFFSRTKNNFTFNEDKVEEFKNNWNETNDFLQKLFEKLIDNQNYKKEYTKQIKELNEKMLKMFLCYKVRTLPENKIKEINNKI